MFLFCLFVCLGLLWFVLFFKHGVIVLTKFPITVTFIVSFFIPLIYKYSQFLKIKTMNNWKRTRLFIRYHDSVSGCLAYILQIVLVQQWTWQGFRRFFKFSQRFMIDLINLIFAICIFRFLCHNRDSLVLISIEYYFSRWRVCEMRLIKRKESVWR